MFYVYISFIVTLAYVGNVVVAQDSVWFTNVLGKEYELDRRPQDLYNMENESNKRGDTVDLQLYYECHCPDCIDFESTQFKKVVNELNQYMNIKTYPYGNAETIEEDGHVEFKCQHGPKECYGNKLHACALKHITNHTEALLFNICMMEPNNKTKGSDDAAALKCASEMNVNKSPILQCAKGKEGIELLKYYGEESKAANFKYVPYVLINGVEWKGTDLEHDVCATFKNPPEVCHQ